MNAVVKSRIEYLCNLVAGKEVLDIGCVNHSIKATRDAYWLHGRIRQTAKYTLGLDYDRQAVDKLASQGFNVQYADATNFDVGKQFDIVIAGEIIEHLVNHAGFFSCIRRHLKPDGVLVLTTPNALCLTYVIQNILYGHENENLDHTCIFSVTTLRTMLSKNGFDLGKVTFFPELEKENLWWPMRVFKYVQLTIACVRPSFCHLFIAECRLGGRDGEYIRLC
jgi:2-polyprenyl-3-methyl-5-hydroxy-6-metoxy-1,4-benzoquinol methylase